MMNEFVTHLKELFEPFGAIRVKRMFGGYGVYCDDLMFGLVQDDVLYLKADAESAGLFKEKGLSPFQYEKKGKLINVAYYTAPEEIFEDADEVRVWLSIAYGAALRAKRHSN
jgi:DNA transformation protein and related proteins